MSLTVVSIPIGNYGDITLRAIESLKNADLVICEELKPARILFKKIGIDEKELIELNEHSDPKDIKELLELCRKQNVCLISDCGTPSFCDPGAPLIEICHREGIKIDVNPGPSSLMTLLSLSGVTIKNFYFAGFLPAEREARAKSMRDLKNIHTPFVIMDTPYRLQATIKELASDFGSCQAVLGVDLTGEKHRVGRDTIKKLAATEWPKAPFVLLVIP